MGNTPESISLMFEQDRVINDYAREQAGINDVADIFCTTSEIVKQAIDNIAFDERYEELYDLIFCFIPKKRKSLELKLDDLVNELGIEIYSLTGVCG